MRQNALRNAILLASTGITVSAAWASARKHDTDVEHHCPPTSESKSVSSQRLLVNRNTQQQRPSIPTNSFHRHALLATSASSVKGESKSRTNQTASDFYYQKHGKIPLPKTIHADLVELSQTALVCRENTDPQASGILVLGDVHGCYEEMLLLHDKAVTEKNDGRPFRFVILVGDLCNKGPDSVKVIRHVRQQPHWYSIRGNHDDSALAAALGDSERLQKKTYQWIVNDNIEEDNRLSDEDIMWLSELPYTIRIPSSFLGDPSKEDTMIVHAGLIPNVALEDQSVKTMVTLREVQRSLVTPNQYIYHELNGDGQDLQQKHYCDPEPWASAWEGPFTVVFGHDAKRGLQRYPWAIGLDTGACYGKQLTGLIIPGKKVVSVDALKVHSPVTYDKT